MTLAVGSWRDGGGDLCHRTHRKFHRKFQPTLASSLEQYDYRSSFCCRHRCKHKQFQPTNGCCSDTCCRTSKRSYRPTAGAQRGTVTHKTLRACHVITIYLCFTLDAVTFSRIDRQLLDRMSRHTGTVQPITSSTVQDAPKPVALPYVDPSTAPPPPKAVSSSSTRHLAILPLFLCAALLF